jgi:RNA 3'-terminal phosphate cyclase
MSLCSALARVFTKGRRRKLIAETRIEVGVERIAEAAREPGRGEVEAGEDQDPDQQLRREHHVEIARLRVFGLHQRLPHAAAADQADETREDLDGDDEAEILRDEQAREHDAEGELKHLTAEAAGDEPLDAAANRVRCTHLDGNEA